MPETFTSKPVRVKMVQWTGHNADEMKDFIGAYFLGYDTHPRYNATIRVGIRETKPVYQGEFIAIADNGYPYIITQEEHGRLYQRGNVNPDPASYKPPRRFEMHRNNDITGVSGEGVVTSGVMWADGRVALRWNTATSSVTVFDSVDDMMFIHGHDGATELVWLDPEQT